MNLGVLVITEQFSLSGAATAFAADGSLVDAKSAAKVAKVVQRLAQVADKLRG